MTPKWMKPAGRWLLGLMLTLAISGCSTDQPLAPQGNTENVADVSKYFTQPGDQVRFAARVATMDQNRRMLTCIGQPDTVTAAHNCEIVRLNNGQETPIPFSDIQIGDSVDVRGIRQQDRNVLANRLQICENGAGNYDVAFRDTIIAIDYAAGSFTVRNRAEVITVDANTIIWGQIAQFQSQAALSARPNPGQGNGDQKQLWHDTVLVFTDLAVGSIVEVKADIISPDTLLATKIKLANCAQSACLLFRSYLATVDVDAKIVTFTDQTWIGRVGQGAKLTGLLGEPLTLADFIAGDYVEVKGFPTTGDTLKICQMSKETI